MPTLVSKSRANAGNTPHELTTADFAAVHQLLREVDEDIRRKREGLETMLNVWWYAVRMLRKIEIEAPETIRRNTQVGALHKDVMQFAIHCGGVLLARFAKQAEIDPLPMGAVIANLEASLKTLRVDLKAWHHPLPAARRKAILEALSGAE